MPKKKVIPMVSIPPIPPILNPEALVMRSIPLQQLVSILLNGAHNPQFTVHSGLMAKIHAAYRGKDTQAFIQAVQVYLEQAVAHVAQAGKREEIPARIEHLTNLIEQAGLDLVARRILSVVHAS